MGGRTLIGHVAWGAPIREMRYYGQAAAPSDSVGIRVEGVASVTDTVASPG